jgi:hypothetical protein
MIKNKGTRKRRKKKGGGLNRIFLCEFKID